MFAFSFFDGSHICRFLPILRPSTVPRSHFSYLKTKAFTLIINHLYLQIVTSASESRFCVVKLMNEKLDDIRRKVYSMEKDVNKRKVLKGTRYLLLGNGADIFDQQHKTRLDNALAMNEPLSKAYYLKEQLRQIWM